MNDDARQASTTADTCVARHRMSTAEVPRDQRFGYWLDMICATYARLECEPAHEREVFGEIEVDRLGTLDMTALRSNVRQVSRTPSLIHGDAREACLVMIQRAGRGWVRQDGREALLVPGDFVMYETSRPYQLRFDDAQHDVIVLRVPHNELRPHVLELQELTATTVPGSCAAGHLLLSMVDTLRRDVGRLHPSSVIGVSEAITSIIAAGLRSLPGANVRRPTQLSAFHMARVKAYVMEHLREPDLSIGSIAEAMRVSPDHLARLFRAEPVPLSRFIWRQRLEACRRELCDPRLAQRSVSEIAFSWGFNDAAHFSRSFREQFGLAPREWRQQSMQQALR